MAVALRTQARGASAAAGRAAPVTPPGGLDASPARKKRTRDVTLTLVAAPESQPFVRRVVLIGVGLFVLLAAVVGLRTYMAQQQMVLDRLTIDVSRARNFYDELRAERAALRSPEVLVQAASALGMVQAPPQPRFMDIPADVAAAVAASAGGLDDDVVSGVGSALAEYGELKNRLHGGS